MSILYDRSTELLRSYYDHRLSTPALLDTARYFPHARLFSDNWQSLRDEAISISREIHRIPRFHELMAEQADISAQDNRDWRMFVLKAYGVSISQNMKQCPVLSSLLVDLPEVLSAALSFLAPHKHIPSHRGPFRGILRFYLGLSVPCEADGTPNTILTIDDVEHRLADGQCLLWDDTFPHEVWNNSDQPRIALLLDIRRSNMPRDLVLLSSIIIRLIGMTIRARHIF